jgi:hypothetical protein
VIPHRTLLIFCLIVPSLATGCRVRPYWLRPNQPELPPEAFTETPTLEDVVYVVNANTQRVHRLQTENATLRVDRFPAPLNANLAYEQPRKFRLRAQLSQFTGRELDMGSNDELFWFWIRRDEHPSVYFARHDEFAISPARDLIPIEPSRLIDALGLVYLDPNARYVGPIEHDAATVELRSRLASPRGDMTRVLLIDRKYGWTAQQHYYDANGQLLLSARSSRHRFYPDDAVTMPHHIEVTVMPGQPSQLTFDVEVGSYVINRQLSDSAERWSMPTIEGYPSVDIADPQFRPPVAEIGTQFRTLPTRDGLTAPYVRGRGDYAPAHTASRFPYRGYHTDRR